MRRNRLRIDLATLLTSLLCGLLPLAVITVISFLSLSTLSAPLYDMVLKEHLDLLQLRAMEIERALEQRAGALRAALRTRLQRLGPCAVPAGDEVSAPRASEAIPEDWDLIAAAYWHPAAREGGGARLPTGDCERAEAILSALPHEPDDGRRHARLVTLASLEPTLEDPVGFSYALESALYLATAGAGIVRGLVSTAGEVDSATLAAALEVLGGQLVLDGLELPVAIRREPAPVSGSEMRLAPDRPEFVLLGAGDASSGTLVVEIPVRPWMARALGAMSERTPSVGGLTFELETRQAGVADAAGLAVRLAPPLGEGWELVLRGADAGAPRALELVARLRGRHYLWWGLSLLLVGGLASIALGLVVSRRVRHSRQKDDFLRLVSHELRTPIASVKMLAETLSLGRIRDAEVRNEVTGQLVAESERLSELVERVLEYGRAEGGRAREVITDPGELVERAVAIFREREPNAGEIVVRTAQEFHPVILDRDAVIRVVLNLLSNARKFSGSDRPIEVTVGEESRNLFVEVRDEGPGIRKRDQRRVFRAFYRGEQSAGAPGFGLGLAYCKEVAESHRGKMRVQSAPGRGAAFTLEIPLVHPRDGGSGNGTHRDRRG